MYDLPGNLYRPLYRLRPVALLPLLLIGHQVRAEFVPADRTITQSDPVQDYRVINGATLTAQGASTLAIVVDPTSGLVLEGSDVASADGTGVQLRNANANVTGSRIYGATLGLSLGSIAGIPGGSTASVQGSRIEGGVIGVQVGTGADFSARDSQISGGTQGLQMGNGQARLQNTTVSGGVGVGINPGSDLASPNRLILDGSSVEGTHGSAILVGDYGLPDRTAEILVNNGSTLKGANGVLLEVIGTAQADMSVDNSQLRGDVVAEPGAVAHLTLQNNASLTGNLKNVERLTVNSQAQWIMAGDGQVANLSLDNGTVRFGEQGQPRSFYTLSVGQLSGNGTFAMKADFTDGLHDFLEVTGNASGSHQLAVTASGQDLSGEASLHMVHIGGGDAQFSLLGGPVDLGTWSYDLVKRGDNDWYLDTESKTISPGTRTVLALFNAAPTVWYGELASLRTRMGELRLNPGNAGGWMRGYGSRYDVEHSAGLGYRQSMQGLSLGVDTPLAYGDGQWLAGVMAGYSHSDLDLGRATNGKVDSYYAGAYATWLDEASGWYFDGVLKFNRMRNKAEVALSDGQRSNGDYSNNGLGASLELGRHLKLDNGYFLEPFAQLSGLVMGSKDYRLDNGMHAEGEQTRSLLGKLGATAGRNFDLGQGRVLQPYVRAAWVHEFADGNQVRVNDNRFNNDLSGSRGELGFGAAASLSGTWQVYADFAFSHGERIEQPWGASLGARYNW
ncbi:autotransporter outer membrane beta-barrel domain-containing protein [Pseudomonas sp. DTU_2021_1001937_2_SI_NGA_ILE_001]|uniref:autotransporter outer membrane beta-barrel domain-containing protein n=1 Tax=Pseudomonas sp. DTU_2021_1001937_2_SI_NGA_ILE_001 TaxID=3077589 RepID=UPI0028FC0E9E|nr:autotransporter outer membrane beta-barrel domain-containing protein [Pseudomonas sp. DTU_2021_1001937_2_SI_NGA_ILE_001]WNW10766.1 autotransporter outer membrane beta-barrel domain-containing protein [Pseudomonas sp. DTU_2021_1001937_2_SI_NGA_ILE_001]